MKHNSLFVLILILLPQNLHNRWGRHSVVAVVATADVEDVKVR